MDSRFKKIFLSFSLLVFLFGTHFGFIKDVGARSIVIEDDQPDFVLDDTLVGICDFPIHVTDRGDLKTRIVFDELFQPKVLTVKHNEFYNTYEANGKKLEGLKTYYMLQVLFRDGVLKDFNAGGVIEKIPLPDGTLFISAGLVSLKPKFDLPQDVPGVGSLLSSGDFYSIVVGAGASGDVSAFCNALQ